MKFLAAAFAALASAALAQQPPAYFRAPSFALTVRAEPGGAAIGELAPGAQPLESTGFDGGRSWVRIQFGERDGWVARDALIPVEAPMLEGAPIPEGLICSGDEPFWSLRFTGQQALFAAPDTEPVAFEISRVAVAEGRKSFPLSFTLIGGEASGVATMRAQSCTDGMSDRSHAWSVDFLTQRAGAPLLVTGCCALPVTAP